MTEDTIVKTAEEHIALIKREIIADVKAKIVPARVASFEELHKYVDADSYGDTLALFDSMSWNKFCDVMNPIRDAVDAWIKTGTLQNMVAKQILEDASADRKTQIHVPPLFYTIKEQ